jgi:hypothetical protein
LGAGDAEQKGGADLARPDQAMRVAGDCESLGCSGSDTPADTQQDTPCPPDRAAEGPAQPVEPCSTVTTPGEGGVEIERPPGRPPTHSLGSGGNTKGDSEADLEFQNFAKKTTPGRRREKKPGAEAASGAKNLAPVAGTGGNTTHGAAEPLAGAGQGGAVGTVVPDESTAAGGLPPCEPQARPAEGGSPDGRSPGGPPG